MRRAREQDQLAQQRAAQASFRASQAEPVASSNGTVELGPLDTTLKLKWNRANCPQYDDESTLKASILSCLTTTQIAALDNFIVSDKSKPASTASNGKTKGKSKSGSAVISFKTLSAAIALYQALGGPARTPALHGLEAKWAAGEPPAAARPVLGTQESAAPSDRPAAQNKASAVRHLFYAAYIPRLTCRLQTSSDEASILQRMRERARLEAEIRAQDEAEES